MAAFVESMFSLREVPWHGLGTIVQEAPTSQEAIKLAGLDWEVTSEPLSCLGKEVPNLFANIRSTDKEILGVTTSKYKIIQNMEAFQFTDALLETAQGAITYETAGSLFNGKKIWLSAKMPRQLILDDEYDVYLCFSNSHDAKGAIRAMITPIRVVCNNTLNLAIAKATRSWSIRHMGNLQERLAEASNALNLCNSYMDEFKATSSALANKKLADADFSKMLEELLPIKEDVTDRVKETLLSQRQDITYRYQEAPDLSNFRGTAYGAIQAVSDYIYHAKPIRMTDTYKDNLVLSAFEGNKLLDKALEILVA